MNRYYRLDTNINKNSIELKYNKLVLIILDGACF